MKKKKILQVCAIDTTMNGLLKPLTDRLVEEGYEVHGACANTGYFETLSKNGLHMVEVPIKRDIDPKSNIAAVRALYRLMKQEKYDIVHVHTPVASILGRIAAKLAGIKNIVYTAHGFYFHEGMPKKEYSFFYNIEKYFAKFATDRLLLQSQEDYELCVEDTFKKADKIIHLSNGVDIHNKFNPDKISEQEKQKYKHEIGIKEEDIVFSFIGRPVKEKGIFELVEAFQKLNVDHKNIKLLLIGGRLISTERDNESQSMLLEQIKENENIIHLGHRSDIPELMSISDTFVLPSYREGLPRSIIEAMAMMKPVIATDIRGCREEVDHEETGYLINKKDSDDLYVSMRRLAEDSEKREIFGTKGRKKAETLFDESKVVEKQLNLFKSMVRS